MFCFFCRADLISCFVGFESKILLRFLEHLNMRLPYKIFAQNFLFLIFLQLNLLSPPFWVCLDNICWKIKNTLRISSKLLFFLKFQYFTCYCCYFWIGWLIFFTGHTLKNLFLKSSSTDKLIHLWQRPIWLIIIQYG
jgi:hypothetical protein